MTVEWQILDQTLAGIKAVALSKTFKQIGIQFTPSPTQKKQIDKYWKQREREQSQRALQSEINDEPFQFPITETWDGWTDELYETAFDAIIEKNIFQYKPLFRGPVFQNIIDIDLAPFDERFQDLPMTNLRDTFYNKYNVLVKQRDMNGNLVADELKEWEIKLNDYITSTGIIRAITSLNSDDGMSLPYINIFTVSS